jgi:hypothetical protein
VISVTACHNESATTQGEKNRLFLWFLLQACGCVFGLFGATAELHLLQQTFSGKYLKSWEGCSLHTLPSLISTTSHHFALREQYNIPVSNF